MATLQQLVAEKAGISEAQANEAVSTVMGFLRERLPAPVASQIDTLIDADVGNVVDQVQSVMGNLGGMFGGKKEGQ